MLSGGPEHEASQFLPTAPGPATGQFPSWGPGLTEPSFAGVELATSPAGHDPVRRRSWGSVMFTDPTGKTFHHGRAVRRYFIDRNRYPVLTAEGRPAHVLLDDEDDPVFDGHGKSVVGAVEVPHVSQPSPVTSSAAPSPKGGVGLRACRPRSCARERDGWCQPPPSPAAAWIFSGLATPSSWPDRLVTTTQGAGLFFRFADISVAVTCGR